MVEPCAAIERIFVIPVMLRQQLQPMNDFFAIGNESTFPKADHAFIPGCNSMRCFLNLQKDFAFYAYVWIRPEQIQLCALLRAVKKMTILFFTISAPNETGTR